MPHAHPSGFPPRALGRARHGEGQALALREEMAFFFTVARGTGTRDRCTARDRPSPYGKQRRFFGRIVLGPLGPKRRFFTVARGPVPRDRWRARGMARDRPSPYGEGQAFFTVARGPVPRDRGTARDRPSPYGEGQAFFHRSAGACPPRSPSSGCVFPICSL